METMTIRPGKKYAGMLKKLHDAAQASGRSLNNYVLYHLDIHLKNENEQITGLPTRGKDHSQTA